MERIKNGFKKFKEEQARLQKEIKEKTIGYILAALGLVAGLAWNEAIKSLIDAFSPSRGSVLIKFVYAAAITVLIVVITVYLVRLTEEKKEQP